MLRWVSRIHGVWRYAPSRFAKLSSCARARCYAGFREFMAFGATRQADSRNYRLARERGVTLGFANSWRLALRAKPIRETIVLRASAVLRWVSRIHGVWRYAPSRFAKLSSCARARCYAGFREFMAFGATRQADSRNYRLARERGVTLGFANSWRLALRAKPIRETIVLRASAVLRWVSRIHGVWRYAPSRVGVGGIREARGFVVRCDRTSGLRVFSKYGRNPRRDGGRLARRRSRSGTIARARAPDLADKRVRTRTRACRPHAATPRITRDDNVNVRSER